MKENTPDDLARDYLKGNLARADRENFEKHLATDPDLAQELVLLRTEMAASELLIAAETRNLFQEWRQEASTRRGFFGNFPVLWSTGIAAGLCLIVAVVWVIYHSPDIPPVTVEKNIPPAETTEPIPKQHGPTANVLPQKPAPPARPPKNYRDLAGKLLPDPMFSNLRRASPDSVMGTFQAAQQAYSTGNYQQTLDLLAQVDSTRRQSVAFLSAHALFRLQRFAEAETQFARLVEWNSRQFRYPAEWGVLMCRLAESPKREKELLRQLNEIVANPDHPFFEQAKALEKEFFKIQ